MVIIDWREEFLGRLGELIIGQEPDLASVTVVFPHRRPRRYLREHLVADPRLPKPCRLPEMLSITELAAVWRRHLEPAPVRTLTGLDQVEALYDIVRRVRDDCAGGLSRLPLDRERFFPWGVRLAGLMEDLFRQNREADNLQYLQGEVMEWAAALLEHLGVIHREYSGLLEVRRWTTPGYDLFQAARRWEEIEARLAPRRYYLAGFYALSRGEETIWRRLWETGRAVIVWHSDPALAAGQPGHWAVSGHREWLERWGASASARPGVEPPTGAPAVRFYEGYDLHSQLAPLEAELAGDSQSGTAVVLPREDLLLPVLHHLPPREVNITLGYPLGRTTLAGFISLLLELQETRNPAGGYYWRPLVQFIRHPYIKMLGGAPGLPWRRWLRAREAALRQGQKYVFPPDADPPAAAPGEGEEAGDLRQLWQEVLETGLHRWEGVRTLSDLAGALAGVGRLLVRRGGDLWERFPLDGECLHRLLDHVAPALADSLMGRQDFDRAMLFAILRQYLQGERVAFEAEPLTGLQVMGMLETRLLRFDRVLIVNATEEDLPGQAAYDPLLPDALRRLAGLTDSRDRDRVAAYNFHRLSKGAREVVLFYQTGVGGTETGVDKASRSRFVEQLLWEVEQARGRMVAAGEPPLTIVSFPMRSLHRRPRPLPRTPALQARLEEWLTARPVSLSALDDYLRCPVRFVYTHLLKLAPTAEISDEADPGAVGELIHQVLQEFFTPLLGREVAYPRLPAAELADLYRRRLRAAEFYPNLGYAARLQLERAGAAKLRAFLATGVETTVVALETPLSAALPGAGAGMAVGGRLDRVDRRPDGLHILDYKTGRLPEGRPGVWADESLGDRLAAGVEAPDRDPEVFQELAQGLGSLQLPGYLYLYWQTAGELAANAGWVELRGSGGEKRWFPEKWSQEQRHRVITVRAPQALAWVVAQMRGPGDFPPRADRQCDWCPHAGACQG